MNKLRMLQSLSLSLLLLCSVLIGLSQDKRRLSSESYVSNDGLTVEQLVELAKKHRLDLMALKQNLEIAKAKILQARSFPNPTLDVEYASPRFLGGEPEKDFSVGISQSFETAGKRGRRIQVAVLEFSKTQVEISELERKIGAEVRMAYVEALAKARQLDTLEKLIQANEQIILLTEARMKQGDVAPLDVSLIKVETDKLRSQALLTKNELEIKILQLKNLIGIDLSESIKIKPQSQRPPRLDLGLTDLINIALKERPDLKILRLQEEIADKKIGLAKANAIPNVNGSLQFSTKKQIVDLPANINGVGLDKDKELKFGVSIKIPIFNRNQAEIISATSEMVQSRHNREYLESLIKQEVTIAYRKYRAAVERLVLYGSQIIPRSEANLQSIQSAYNFGEFSIFEVIAEQRKLLEFVTEYNDSLREYYASIVELELAIGTNIPANAFSVDSLIPYDEKAFSNATKQK
mgnify:FL=1